MLQSLMEKAIADSEVDVFPENDRDAVEFLVAARELHRLTGDLARIAEDMVVAALDGARRKTVGERTVEVRRAYRRTEWEHSKLAMHVALRATQGEVIDGMAEIVDEFVKCCNPSWRVTALKERGLDDADYCTRELSRASVSVL